jgi:hypothetical protein
VNPFVLCRFQKDAWHERLFTPRRVNIKSERVTGLVPCLAGGLRDGPAEAQLGTIRAGHERIYDLHKLARTDQSSMHAKSRLTMPPSTDYRLSSKAATEERPLKAKLGMSGLGCRAHTSCKNLPSAAKLSGCLIRLFRAGRVRRRSEPEEQTRVGRHSMFRISRQPEAQVVRLP